MAHRRVGDQPFQIGLHDAHDGAVDDADDREPGDERRRGDDGRGEERDGEAQETVDPHLQKDAGQDDASRRRGLGMRVGQPGMEGKHRHLDREGEGEGRKKPVLLDDRQAGLVRGRRR